MNKVFEKILERLEGDCVSPSGYPGYMIDLEDACNIVKEVAEEYKDGWIPCSSGSLPDDMEDILIDMGGTKPIPAYIQNGEWYLTDCRGSSEKVKDQSRVIAWQPLPPEYQPKGE